MRSAPEVETYHRFNPHQLLATSCTGNALLPALDIANAAAGIAAIGVGSQIEEGGTGWLLAGGVSLLLYGASAVFGLVQLNDCWSFEDYRFAQMSDPEETEEAKLINAARLTSGEEHQGVSSETSPSLLILDKHCVVPELGGVMKALVPMGWSVYEEPRDFRKKNRTNLTLQASKPLEKGGQEIVQIVLHEFRDSASSLAFLQKLSQPGAGKTRSVIVSESKALDVIGYGNAERLARELGACQR